MNIKIIKDMMIFKIQSGKSKIKFYKALKVCLIKYLMIQIKLIKIIYNLDFNNNKIINYKSKKIKTK